MTILAIQCILIISYYAFYVHACRIRRHIARSNVNPGRCIDGSPPVFYLRKGADAEETRWHVHFEGGGWCYDKESCAIRSKMRYGSTKSDPQCLEDNWSHYLSSSRTQNPLLHSWHTVYVRYCDGGSYAGNSMMNTTDRVSDFL